MASWYLRHGSAMQVGSNFTNQYYPVLLVQPDLVHKFYSLGSTMILVDGNSSNSANDFMKIHRLLMSLNLAAIEIQTTNSLYSWHGGVLVVVSGMVKIRGFNKKRKFVQIIFLIPLGDGYLILNDIFQFINDDASAYQNQAPILLGGIFDTQPNSSSALPEPHASDFVWGQDMHDSVDAVLNPVGECSLAQQQQQEGYGTETAGETPVEENVSASFQSMANIVQEGPPAPAMEEHVGEDPKKTYASVLRGSKGQPGPSFSAWPSLQRSSPATSEWNHTPQPDALHSNSTVSLVPQARVDVVESLHRSSPATSERNQTPQPAAQHSNSTLSLVPQARVDAVESLYGSSPSTSERNQTPQPAAQHSNSTLSLVPQARLDAVESLHGSSPATSERNQRPQPAAQHSSSTLSLVPQTGVYAVESLHGSSPATSERNQRLQPAAQHSNSTLSLVPQTGVDALESLHRSSATDSERNQTPQPAAQHSNSTLSLVPRARVQARVDVAESLHRSSPATSERNQTPQPAAQHSSSTLSLVPQAGVDAVDEGLPVEKEGEPKSVYVMNLPPTITKKKIRKKFKKFGHIIPNGILITSQNPWYVQESCRAVVEFEDLISVKNALEASPIQLAGSEVYILRKMPVESSTYQGRGRGRGRGSDQMTITWGSFGLLGSYPGGD
ncbi:nuclear transport factor 2-like isoform X2 [Carya illinoinensis]|uniref:nuclear transport factor 2-like isoform X2 n=1 Tax=Carya illinoinensis TaxID=32201 RepID=UPI001C718E5B|nr:nuclear transport factor 2-like isoform X2 [Carya illinoinensis]